MGRISALTELTSLASDDYLVVLDSSANIAKKITVANAFGIPDLGFTAAGESWTYASATTITVPSNATTKYAKGNIIKITQTTGGTKYGVITNVASTLLTVVWLDGATLANETISSPSYSIAATPLGSGQIRYPQVGTDSSWDWVSFTPTFTNLTIGNGTLYAKYKQIGKVVHITVFLQFGSTTSVSGGIRMTLPVAMPSAVSAYNWRRLAFCNLVDEGSAVYDGTINSQLSSTEVQFFAVNVAGTYSNPGTQVNATTPHTWANTDKIAFNFSYECA